MMVYDTGKSNTNYEVKIILKGHVLSRKDPFCGALSPATPEASILIGQLVLSDYCSLTASSLALINTRLHHGRLCKKASPTTSCS